MVGKPVETLNGVDSSDDAKTKKISPPAAPLIVRGVPNDADAYLTRLGRVVFKTGDTSKYEVVHPIAMGSIYNLKNGKSAQKFHKAVQGVPWTLWTSHGTTPNFWSPTKEDLVIPDCELLQYLPWGQFPRTDLYYEAVKRSEDLFAKQSASYGFREKWANGNWLKTGISTLCALTALGSSMDDVAPFTLMMGTFLFIDDTVDNHSLFKEVPASIVGKVADNFNVVMRGASVSDVATTFGIEPAKFNRLFPDYTPLTHMITELRGQITKPDNSGFYAIEEFLAYTRALTPEAELRKARSEGKKVKFEEYVDVRRDSVGIYPCLEMVSFVRGVKVPQDIRDDDLFIKLRKMCAVHVVFANLRYLNGEYGGDFAKCFQSVVDDTNQICIDFEAMYPDLLERYKDHPGRDGMTDYVNIMRGWMDGHAYWMLLCDRYLIDEFKCILHMAESEIQLDDIDVRYGGAYGY
ncbi:Alpha-muurolene synthase [Folsomia candida]|uniref:Alpha-muurolene synthase n=1 Tax=Folsomia candida TaxID=158441 RepID=A0A226DE95_FOLCA|nr:Alpha-muurolene synthase [Folsomia candida]